jgi:hypothetical protein
MNKFRFGCYLSINMVPASASRLKLGQEKKHDLIGLPEDFTLRA